MRKQLQNNLLLVLTALIWGSSFVAQRAGMEYIEPFTFNGIRSFIGGLVLIPVILAMERLSSRDQDGKACAAASVPAAAGRDARDAAAHGPDGTEKSPEYGESYGAHRGSGEQKNLLKGGLACGLLLFFASSLQQIAMVHTSAGKTGFITALYIVIIPLMGLFLGKRVRPLIWLCVALGIAGMYLLCITEDFTVNRSDFLVLLSAFLFSAHVLVIDHFSPMVNGVKMSCIQFFVCGILSLPFMLLLETISWPLILDCWLPLMYAGALSCGVAYTLQIIAQKNADPTVASLLMSLESVFAVLSGALVLHEHMSSRELCGCLVMFAAIILAQLPERAPAKAGMPGSAEKAGGRNIRPGSGKLR